MRRLAMPVGAGYGPYVWAPSPADVEERHGVRSELVLKFDQNVPPVPGVPQVPLAASFARLNEYPDGQYRELRDAAAAYTGLRRENVVVGAGADDLILLVARVFLGRGRRASIVPPTYGLYRIATQLAAAELASDGAEDVTVAWRCNPNNPTGAVVPAAELVGLARGRPDTVVVVDEAYVEFGGETCAPWVDELPNLVVLRTLSKAFGFAALRVGYALAHPDTATLLEERRAPAPIAGPAAAIAAAALRDPRYDVGPAIAERERVRAALATAGWDVPPTATNFVWITTQDATLGRRLEALAAGDLHVDEHHTVEDVAASLGTALAQALGGREGVARYGSAVVPMDEARALAAVDLVRRPHAEIALAFSGERVGGLALSLLPHALERFAMEAGCTVHVEASGGDDHHVAEAAFKALGQALRQAVARGDGGVRSTKGAA
jgi:histidinol-phosphate/aromatic aminotransferase/cobyric acid decarboxylase-like protein